MMRVGKDKFIHAGINFAVVTAFVLLGQTKSGASLAAGLSIGKEVGDYFNPNSTGYQYDLIADAVGIALGLLLMVI